MLNRVPKNQLIELSDDVGFFTEKDLQKFRRKNKVLDLMLTYKDAKQEEVQWLRDFNCNRPSADKSTVVTTRPANVSVYKEAKILLSFF